MIKIKLGSKAFTALTSSHNALQSVYSISVCVCVCNSGPPDWRRTAWWDEERGVGVNAPLFHPAQSMLCGRPPFPCSPHVSGFRMEALQTSVSLSPPPPPPAARGCADRAPSLPPSWSPLNKWNRSGLFITKNILLEDPWSTVGNLRSLHHHVYALSVQKHPCTSAGQFLCLNWCTIWPNRAISDSLKHWISDHVTEIYFTDSNIT